MGAAWGDYDSDGDVDLYVTAYGDNVLYENRGNGTFEDVTQRSGTNDPRFSTGCNWADYDRDGDLDLYVCNYVNIVYRGSDRGVVERQYATEQPFTLNPSSYEPSPNALFRNRGDGTFEEVAAASGVADGNGRSMSASWVDLDNDGWQDLYVANDVSINGVFRNKADGTFEDIGPSSLAADYRGAMGIAVSDIDDDLDQDVLITHWIAQENALYRNMMIDPASGRDSPNRAWFHDAADDVGLGQISLDMVGWATGFCDFDNDGLRDLWIVNGSTLQERYAHERLVPQRAFLFWNQGGSGYVNVAETACTSLSVPFVGRGGCQADLDRDGRVDLVLPRHGDSAMVLMNSSREGGHWLRVRLRQDGGNTQALGAKVFVTAGNRTQMVEIGAGSSYLSQSETTAHFGLGGLDRVEAVRVVWPDGVEETHAAVGVDRVQTISHTPKYSAGWSESGFAENRAAGSVPGRITGARE